ncbi:LysM peptidoglycan-binding domain-containing protein [Micromonospora costi]|uniref:LysM domain-containing protein n=1 Tax=Micromonospora costi TaxID=1530042 RepID=A0A3B0AER1_9ACTN|nr:LysM domain-containing protein [Micromonospora costi]RKN58899.1 LysM domain-containing protein [Micromonospora costi]
MGRSAVRRIGRVLTGLGALIVLCAVLVGAPVALLAFAGNPLPDHVPTLAEIGTALTSRDDGQLFLRALALAGWFGWATFALSVLVELGAQAVRRPAPRLPGMGRQQRAAAVLVGSVALIVATAPAASAAVATTQVYAAPATGYAQAAPAAVPYAAGPVTYAAGPTGLAAGPVGLAVSSGSAALASGHAATDAPTARDAPPDSAVYRVAKGDYLGAIAERYLDEFSDYRDLARLNRLADPDRIRPGQLLKLPEQATDRGVRPHATGRLVDRPAPAPERATPERDTRPTPAPATAPPAGEEPEPGSPDGEAPAMTVGAARVTEPDRVNRPLAVSAVLAVASIVGAQIGAVLGLRRRPAPAGGVSGGRPRTAGRVGAAATGSARALPSGQAGANAQAAGELPTGRHRRD